MAKKSPKVFAEQIRRRNKALLKKLMLLEPYIDKTFGEVPDAVWKEVLKGTEHGCPHCHVDCKDCLWTKATHQGCFECAACSSVKFDGVSLAYFQECYEDGNVAIDYSADSECIGVNGCWSYDDIDYLLPGGKFRRESWEKAVRFVKGHIEWTKLSCWGSEYKRKPMKRLGN